MSLYADLVKRYQASPGEAKKLLAVGSKPANPALPTDRIASLCHVISAIMNLDACCVKR